MSKRKRSREQRASQGYFIRLTNIKRPYQIGARYWQILVRDGVIEPEADGSHYAVPRHGRSVAVENRQLYFYSPTPIGPPLMTNATIMDAYLTSYCYLEPDVLAERIREEYNPFREIPRHLRPTEEEAHLSIQELRPLVEWLRARQGQYNEQF